MTQRDDTRSFIPLRHLWNDLVDGDADPHDIVQRWRLSEDHREVADTTASWLEQRWTAGRWTPAQKDRLLFAVDAIVNAETNQHILRTRPFRQAVGQIMTVALSEGRQVLSLTETHAPSWRDPWGPVEHLIAQKVDYLLCALEITTTFDRTIAVQIARAALDQVRETTPAFGAPGHISNKQIGDLAYLASHQRFDRLVDRERVIRLYGQGPSSDPMRDPITANWRKHWDLIHNVLKAMPVGTVSLTFRDEIYRVLTRSLIPKSARPTPRWS